MKIFHKKIGTSETFRNIYQKFFFLITILVKLQINYNLLLNHS